MKQQIVKISNIKFTGPVRIHKPADITQTFIYEDLKRTNPAISDDELIKKSHIGFVLAQLHNFYDCTYDVETITPNDVRYQEAVDEIASYVETDWFMDDADIVQSADIELLDETYDFEYQHTLYMYFDSWIQNGYEAYLSVADWKAAFHQIVYEYMRDFLTVEVS
jgi:hypothetical protein